MTTLQQVREHETIKQVLSDSFGGIMYNVANVNKYDSTEVIAAWESLTPPEQEAAGGIIKGAICFLKEGV